MAATALRLARYSACTSARVRWLRKFVSGLYEVDQGLTPDWRWAAWACTWARVAWEAVVPCANWPDRSGVSAWAAKPATDRTATRARDLRFMITPWLGVAVSME